MKKKLLNILVSVVFCTSSLKVVAQEWVAVGPDDFKQASLGRAVFPNMALYNGVPYIAFRDGNRNNFVVRKYNGVFWESVGTPIIAIDDIEWTSIAFDGSGGLYVAHYDESSYAVTVHKFDGSNWTIIGVESFTTNVGSGYSFRVASDGTPYVSYFDNTHLNISVQKFNGLVWEFVGIPIPLDSGGETEIAIDSNGIPYVVYTDGENLNKATVQKFNGSQWEIVGEVGFSRTAHIICP